VPAEKNFSFHRSLEPVSKITRSLLWTIITIVAWCHQLASRRLNFPSKRRTRKYHFIGRLQPLKLPPSFPPPPSFSSLFPFLPSSPEFSAVLGHVLDSSFILNFTS
jgi:hypothetical protein